MTTSSSKDNSQPKKSHFIGTGSMPWPLFFSYVFFWVLAIYSGYKTLLKLLLECYGKYIEDNVILEAYQVILATMREQVGGQNDYCSWVSTGKLID